MTRLIPRPLLAAALAAALFIPSVRALADDPPAPPASRPAYPAPVPQGRVALIIQRDRFALDSIKLTDDQKSKVDDIYADVATKLQAFSTERDIEPQQRFQRLFGALNDAHTRISAILTDEQRNAYDDKLAQLREQRRNGGGFGRRGMLQANPNATIPAAPPSAQILTRRVRESIAKLDLTDDQKSQLKPVLDDMDKRMGGAFAEEFNNNPEANRDKAREIFADIREQIQAILTPDQQAKLRTILQQAPPSDDAKPSDKTDADKSGADKSSADKSSDAEKAPSSSADEKMTDEKMTDETMTKKVAANLKPANKPLDKSSAKPKPAETPTTPLVKLNQPAPDFSLKRIDGATTTLADYKDHVLVLIFGSFTTPTFRYSAPAITNLAHDYADRATFLVIYTNESHPSNGWEVERNKTDQVKIEEPKTEIDKLGVAKKAREVLKFTIPFAVDTLTDTTAQAYGTYPNGAVIISRDGNVAFAQHWCDPATLRRHLNEAIGPKTVAEAK